MGYGVRHLRFADYRVTPWKNGAGVTREIAAAAASVGSETPPDWRISMATITEDAPFSGSPASRARSGSWTVPGSSSRSPAGRGC